MKHKYIVSFITKYNRKIYANAPTAGTNWTSEVMVEEQRSADEVRRDEFEWKFLLINFEFNLYNKIISFRFFLFRFLSSCQLS